MQPLRPRRLSSQLAAALVVLTAVTACGPSKEQRRADSARAAAAEQQTKLAKQLAAQKDSLTSVVLEADRFISQIDSQISRVKGLPRRKKAADSLEGPLQQQIFARKQMLARVNALVQRANETSAQLAESRKQYKDLQAKNAELQSQIDRDQQMIAQLGETIQRQEGTITTLTARVDSLANDLALARAMYAKAFYVIGTQDELIQKGIVVQEGGANLLFAHPGRTLQPARTVDPDAFRAIDLREVRQIPVPDTTRNYKVVSRQSLDYADVAVRDQSTFRGNLKITNTDRFWAPSRFLIIVEQ
jgi:septal ring factor EnvC (AmiA/AmiB activator)